MNHIEREKIVIRQMIEIYCRSHHKKQGDGLCDDCLSLLAYANKRLDHCPKGNSKSSCRKCEIHCYSPEKRERIREVMRYAGPRMIFLHPIAVITHMFDELK